MIIDFEITKNGFTHRDALVLPDGHNLTEAEIEAMKQARFDAWYAIMTMPPDTLEMEKMTDG
jgi:hypothetical protein